MKRNLLLPVLLLFTVFMGGQAFAQTPCTVDPNITAPGIFPSDTLPDITAGQAYSEVVQFAFPPDTTLFGFTLAFDSFVVNTILNLPTGIDWQCDQFNNNCTYYTSPPALTQGCVTIFDVSGGPMQNPSYPAYDSVLVLGEGWVTVPFVGPQAATDTIAIYYRVGGAASVENPLLANLNMEVAPNPVTSTSRISFNLTEIADAKVAVYDVYGKEVAVLSEERQIFGAQSYEFNGSIYPAGIYFVKVELNNGTAIETKKLINVH